MSKRLIKNKIEKDLDFGVNKTKGFFNEFRDFAIKGNVLDLAIGVVIGTAFTGIVNKLVTDIITPLLSVLTGSVDFSNRFLVLKGGHYATLAEAQSAKAIVLTWGDFLNAVINFVIVALVIFVLVKYVIKKKKEEKKEEVKATKQCPFCMEQVDLAATRCKFCTSKLEITQ